MSRLMSLFCNATTMKTTQSPSLLPEYLLAVALACIPLAVHAETFHVDAIRGRDANPGSAERPLQTLTRVAELVNAKTTREATTVKLRSGVYPLSAPVVFENQRAYSQEQRLTLEAFVLPDDPEWQPGVMPNILSIEDPRPSTPPDQPTQTYGLKIKMSHVTVRGLKFLGNPLFNNWYCPLECLQTNLTDVLVTQCMFAGNPDTLDIYCGVITDGHEFVVDHCIFSGCHACAVFWDGDRGVVGRQNAMRYCIVEGARISGVWTCETDEDFAFHHNIVTGSEYFWLRKRGAPQTYRVRDCVVSGNRHFSGYGVAAGATGPTGTEIRFAEEGVEKDQAAKLQRSRGSKHYLHVIPGTPGSQLGAGLFKQLRETARDRISHIENSIIRDIPQLPRLCDSLDVQKEKIGVGDCRLYCEQEGIGTPVVLINGGPGGNHHGFHPHFSRARQFAKIIYYDQRGCGLSDYEPGRGYTLDQAVDDLEQLRKGLGVDSWIVLGWSYGGLVAQCYAIKYPERLRGLVLVCASTGLYGPWETPRQQEFISPEEQKKIQELWRAADLSTAQFMFNKALNGDWKRQSYYRPTREEMARDALYGWVNDKSFPDTIDRSLKEVDLQGLFTRCPIPTLILEGQWDMTWGADKPRKLHENHPNARLVVFEESAHRPFGEEPVRFFAELSRFLRELPSVSQSALGTWREDLAQQGRSGAERRIAEGPMSPAEKEAIAEFLRRRELVLQGDRFEDASTPLNTLLSFLSASIARDLEAAQRMHLFQNQAAAARSEFDGWTRDLSRLEVFRAPPAPAQAKDGDIWVIYTQVSGESRLEDAYFFIRWKQRWVHGGNLGGPAVARRWHRLADELKNHYLPFLERAL